MTSLYRHLPAVDACLERLASDKALAAVARPLVKDAVNAFLDLVREEIRAGAFAAPEDLGLEALAPRLRAFVARAVRPHLQRTVNATGVVVHTNLGRSRLAPAALQAVHEAAAHYSNLEFDLATGARGSRYSHVEDILCRVTGAEAAMAVNNNAAAVLLLLDTVAKGKEVIVSRGQLVEIGGSFRIPEVMKKSGATLVEVGATNRTHLKDYEAAVTERTGALMRVHTSNYRMVGFTKEVSLEDLVALGAAHGLPVIEDLGSGTLYDFGAHGGALHGEPTVQQVVAAGPDAVCFSGDKVLGGPQAGIIVGKRALIDRLKANQLTRALRVDKMTLAALEATLRLYADPELAAREAPTLAMMLATPQSLRGKARRLAAVLKKALGERAVIGTRAGESRVGGGAFPERGLPTTLVTVALSGYSAEALRDALLASDPPVIGRIEDDLFCLDPRTLEGAEYSIIANALNTLEHP